jgi:nitric oxide reductase subunit B
MSQFQGKKIARWYVLYAVFLFSVQGVVAILGASDLIIPDLPSPIPYEYGRSIHLGLATFWPLIGSMGLVYYFLVEQLKSDIYSPKIAKWQFAIVFLSTSGLYGTLAFRIGNGREYLEGLSFFYLGISFSIAIGIYNLVRTLWKQKKKLIPSSIIMTLGQIFMLILLLPNALNIINPVADEAVKFWVVHLWEEMAFELTTSGFVASFFIASGIAEKRDMEKWLYLEASLAVSGGLFGTGHHYYWIGFPKFWLIIGFVFSLIQVIPVFLLAYLTYKGLKKRRPMDRREKFSLWLILSSLFYHLTGASLLGLLMTVPWVNLYMHGTLITSGHAHLALFGVMGFLVLAGAGYILSEGYKFDKKSYLVSIMSVLLLNIGLIIMSSALLIAGFLQTYLYYLLGMEFIQVSQYINPYLILRVMGGLLFTVGDLLLSWGIFKMWRETRKASEFGN